jgi:hypothetical protein
MSADGDSLPRHHKEVWWLFKANSHSHLAFSRPELPKKFYDSLRMVVELQKAIVQRQIGVWMGSQKMAEARSGKWGKYDNLTSHVSVRRLPISDNLLWILSSHPIVLSPFRSYINDTLTMYNTFRSKMSNNNNNGAHCTILADGFLVHASTAWM